MKRFVFMMSMLIGAAVGSVQASVMATPQDLQTNDLYAALSSFGSQVEANFSDIRICPSPASDDVFDSAFKDDGESLKVAPCCWMYIGGQWYCLEC